ncbi:MAG: hypothetical protein J0M12_01540 [Deltaproteobacteria bacterium]|nr:hypothetical protein [Deltaproteobacteria bacterium]
MTFFTRSRFVKLGLTLTAGALCSCTTVSNAMNPFYETPPPVALLGEMNDHALNGGSNNEDGARKALTAMASYKSALPPQPVDPVIQPAVVRLMWIPDHLNKNGDLVPAHYYYLKVLKDRWAVQDAFELEGQLSPNKGTGATAGLPFVPESEANQ